MTTYREYSTECGALAENAADLVADGDHDDIFDAVAELVDGHQWSIYYFGHGIIMEHTENVDAALDAGLDDCLMSYGWLAVRSHFAVPAFLADVMARVSPWMTSCDVEAAAERRRTADHPANADRYRS
jgi:hypothetical protein